MSFRGKSMSEHSAIVTWKRKDSEA
ncbi:OsmC family peroxiredoxin, partial [Vibrio cholerae]|nr:OsmC family peroxiredoxin [Vibrio cholerae]